jgi:ABC-2 type transport system permease protein
VGEPLIARDSLALYGRLVRGHVRGQLQYRTSFAADVIASAVTSGLDFLAILIIFSNVPALGGWGIAEVGVLFGLSTVAFSITDLLVGHLDRLPDLIRAGTFDLVLVRPRGTLFQVIASDFALRRLGRAAQGMVVLWWALANVEITWTWDRVVFLPIAVLAAVGIFAGVWVTLICIVFWFVDGREIVNAFTDGGTGLAQYPLEIYGIWVRRLLAYVIPSAFVAYLPATYLLQREPVDGIPSWLALGSPLVAAALAVVGGLTWRFAVRHYRSAGG